ncbi:unnamed protein product, partial [marine sediment metagenome]
KAQTPEVVNGFVGMFAKTMKAEALDVKQKELIALAVGLTERYILEILAEHRVVLRAHGTYKGGRSHENVVQHVR